MTIISYRLGTRLFDFGHLKVSEIGLDSAELSSSYIDF